MRMKSFLANLLITVSIAFISVFNCSYASQQNSGSASEATNVWSQKLSINNSHHWTLEEMRNAKPGIPQIFTANEPIPPSEAPVGKDLIRAPLIISEPAEPIEKTKDLLAQGEREAGVIFFKLRGVDYFCSASTINSPRKNTVLSAAHCLLNEGNFATDVTYVPAYDTRNANPMPYNQWPASAYFISKDFKETLFSVEDQTIITLYPQRNLEIVDVVGGYGLGINYSSVQTNVRILGYTRTIAGEPVETGIPRECRGSTEEVGPYARMLGCLVGAGSSGSPYLLNRVAFAANRGGFYGPGNVVNSNFAAPNSNSVAKLLEEATNSYVFSVGSKIDVELLHTTGFIGVEGTLPPVTILAHSTASGMLHLRGGVIETGHWQFSVLFLNQSGKIARESFTVTVL